MSTHTDRPQVTIYVDGSCLKNPGTGGYGCVILCNGRRKEISEGFKSTTNNRMEILAACKALMCLTMPCEVTIFSDSKILTDAFNQNWLDSWRRNNWRGARHKPVKNIDLWKLLSAECDKHKVTFEWIKGHCGIVDNEICDSLAQEAASMGDEYLSEDHGYRPLEKPPTDPPDFERSKQLNLFGCPA